VRHHRGLQLGIGAGGASPDTSAGAPLTWVLTGVPDGLLDEADIVAEWVTIALVHRV
jgi:hypothetical protein